MRGPWESWNFEYFPEWIQMDAIHNWLHGLKEAERAQKINEFRREVEIRDSDENVEGEIQERRFIIKELESGFMSRDPDVRDRHVERRARAYGFVVHNKNYVFLISKYK